MKNRGLRYNSQMPTGFKGQFSLKVTRLTSDVSSDLPAALLGAAALSAGYQSSINVPSGLTLTVTEGLNNAAGVYGAVDFSYTDGTNTDIVRVESPTLQYPELITLLNTDVLVFQAAKMTLAGNADTSQFNNNVFLKQNNVFGSRSEQTFEPASYLKSTQFQSNQIDLPLSGPVDKETVLTLDIVQDAGIQVTFNFFISDIVKMNAASLIGK